jgi:tRNA-Thr(GGU) m(6)t(6)A37 methyltransferase TsaA
MEINYKPIGLIHSPFKDIEGMPIQPTGASGVSGSVEVFVEYTAGLKDLEGFSHIILVYHFHRAKRGELIVTPFLDLQPHGVFATRAPNRPNPIGISVVKLSRIEGNVLQVENVDILDGTPLLDIKPFVPEFDAPQVQSIGWLANAKHSAAQHRADDRFS